MVNQHLRDTALFVGSVAMDVAQEFVLFNAALCGIPSISGVGVVITAICGLAVVGLAGLSSLFALVWGIGAYWLTKDEIFLGAGVLEALPGISGLPMFTGATIYYFVRRNNKSR